jgi:putative hydrolase of the HAD superfamily
MKVAGFIFDFDGLILDTEVPRFTSWQEEFARHGFPLTHRDWWKTIGTGPSAYDPAIHLVELTNGKVDIRALRESAHHRADELLEQAELLPGVKLFIEAASEAKLPMAVASSSNRDWVVPHLEKFNILKHFQAVFAAQDVTNVKPDPELYLLAISSLGLPVETIIAFEDSPNGIKAAKLAGLRCVAVPNSITSEMDLSLADIVKNSFLEMHPADTFSFD